MEETNARTFGEGAMNILSCWTTVFTLFLCLICSEAFTDGWSPSEDVVTPYEFGKHGSPRSHRQIRDCQPIKYDNVTHHTQKAHDWDQNGRVPYPITDLNYFYDDLPFGERAPGHIVWVKSPARTVSVLEPFDSGGCTNHHRATVDTSAKQENCLVAVNAGYFNTRSGDCYGNVVSNGRLVQTNGGLQNAHFGIRADGTLVFGYLSEEDVLQKENPFVQLVGGVGWLLRDGEIYVEESRKAECGDVEESGTVDAFFDMLSARVAVGSDDEGNLVIAAIDGQSKVRGVSMSSFASWLLSHGVKNAINLDGGGSATYVINGTIANNPSDHCRDSAFRCPRQVSTIVCVHEPRCDPRDCNNHGDCIQGECSCHANWHGLSCDQLQCGDHNCSGKGICHGNGCRCDVGYLPPDCTRTCPSGWYGQDCSYHCDCLHGWSCDPVSGECACLPGYTGKYCQDICAIGYYGPGCYEECECSNGLCPCHHITGSCMISHNDSYYGSILKVGECLASRIIQDEGLVPDKPLLEDQLTVLLIIAVAVAIVSILCNFICLCFRCSCKCATLSCDNGYSVSRKHVYHQLGNEEYTEEEDNL
ncbi:N-acetylglucosamine-1-phosphodiester alpha-N-acetylglucosaminidase-like [Strongylocentrotus purpuratus]|uniref:EGF-like domain-containing protein n=1 Tax=Strongylocentrotus purpuratus TaxID=7668 RepID=A0A7M7N6A4_STRPU|nr:N-acetylglucosamine-1-phosphodiester alpha-N-acetylglucosaminidase-like [Strongylocentrotus purpuratus]